MEGTIAQVMMFAGNFAPRAWSFCQGQLLAISQYNAVFSLLGTMYGGDGRTTFALPDLRGRTPIGHGHGPGLTNRPIGQKGGPERVTLSQLEMPVHNHTANTQSLQVAVGADSSNGGVSDPNGAYPAISNFTNAQRQTTVVNSYSDSADTTMAPATVSGQLQIGNAGGSQSHENMQPFLAIPYVICLSGVYPSRN